MGKAFVQELRGWICYHGVHKQTEQIYGQNRNTALKNTHRNTGGKFIRSVEEIKDSNEI